MALPHRLPQTRRSPEQAIPAREVRLEASVRGFEMR